MKSFLISLAFLLSINLTFAQPRKDFGGKKTKPRKERVSPKKEKMVNVIHIVQQGETVRSISTKYKTPLKQLIEWNQLSNKIKKGQKLIVKRVTERQAKQFLINNAKYRNKIQMTKGGILIKQSLPKSVESSLVQNTNTPDSPIPPQTPQTKEIKQNKGATEATYPTSDIDSNLPKAKSVNEDAIAVVIGNKDYENKDVPKVDFALRDAQSMKKHLVESMGFKEGNIIYYENASQANFNSVFGNAQNHKGLLFNYVKEGKSDVFIFYSGHGGPDPETKEPYFIPVDCEPSLVSLNGYSMNQFYENLGKVPYRSLNVVIDACFSGASEKGMLLKNISPVFIKPKDKVFTDENATIITAAAGDQVASWYPEQGHSLLSYFYMKGLQGAADMNKDKKVTLEEMESYLKENVTYMARRLNNRVQNPEISGAKDLILIQN